MDEWKEGGKKIPIPVGSGYNFISYLISLSNYDLPWKETSHYNWGTSPSQQLSCSHHQLDLLFLLGFIHPYNLSEFQTN